MQLEMDKFNKVQQILNSLPKFIPSKNKESIREALQVFCANPNFTKVLDSVHNINEGFCDSEKENSIITLPIRLNQPEGQFDAELELLVHEDNAPTLDVGLNIVCADQILYDIPLNIADEVNKFWRLKPENYTSPKGSKIIYSEYLDRTYFAFLKKYYFMANFSPFDEQPVTLTQLISLDSQKASECYPEYMPDALLAVKLGVHQHCGGTQLRKTSLHCDMQGNVLDKEVSLETYFRVLREYRKYKITPQTRGCLIERTEEGWATEHRRISKRSVEKQVNIPFDRLESMGDVFNEFEKRCSKLERSKLVAKDLHKEYRVEKSKCKREDFKILGKKRFHENSREQIEHGRRPVDPCSENIKLSYLQNKALKALTHDDSVQYAIKRGDTFNLIDYVIKNFPYSQESISTITTKTAEQCSCTSGGLKR